MDLDAELDLLRALLRNGTSAANGTAHGVQHALGPDAATADDADAAVGTAAADRVLGRKRRVVAYWDGSGGRAAMRAARRHDLPVLFVVDRASPATPPLRRLRRGIATTRARRGDARAAYAAVAAWRGTEPFLLWAPTGDVHPVAALRARLVARGVPVGTLDLLAARAAR